MLEDLFEPEPRQVKPRCDGLTYIIDNGHGVGAVDDLLGIAAAHVDLAKLGWGTAGVTERLDDKIAMYRNHDVDVCFGGTLFEICHMHDRLDDYRKWAQSLGVTTVEISDGTIEMELDEKLELIQAFAEDFTVLSEVGSKDPAVVVAPARWVKAIQAELDAGSTRVVLEGRESGTSGLYRQTGEMRTGLVQEILDAGIGRTELVFEAPQRSHQAYLIDLLGPNVNLANIAPADVIGCETLRRGLRSDTLRRFHAPDC